MEYFTHQNLDEALIKNVPDHIYSLMDPDIYKIISDELICYNPWVKDCVSAGDYVHSNGENEDNEYMLTQMNSRYTFCYRSFFYDQPNSPFTKNNG